MVLESGDSVMVARGYYLVSDSAVSQLDLALRTSRRDLEQARADLADAREIADARAELIDTLEVSLAGERAYRSISEQLLAAQQSPFVEMLENFGLAAGGFAVCRLTEPR